MSNNTLHTNLEKYLGQLGAFAYNVTEEETSEEVDPAVETAVRQIIKDLAEMMLTSHDPGIIIDGDELTKNAYNKGMKIYNKRKTRLHTHWALFTCTTILLLTIILGEFN
jgi:hypothetical protein